jgi:hypothetical protein
MDAVHTLAISTLAYVDAATADQLLTSVVPDACVASARSADRERLELYRAVGARDANGMAAAATAVLRDSSLVTPAAREYALVAGMLGFAASGRPEEGAQLWMAHTSGPAASTGPEIRLMLSMASGGEPGTLR